MVASTADDNVGDSGLGETSSFETLYRDYFAELCRKLRRNFGAGPPEPEDVVQAAFARLAAVKNPADVKNPRAFLFATARNIIYDHKRRQRRHFDYAQGLLAENSALDLDELTPERVYIHGERFEIVRKTIEKLPEKQKVVLNLHRNHGRTYQQIADETGWSYGHVRAEASATFLPGCAARDLVSTRRIAASSKGCFGMTARSSCRFS
ncbi:MAG: RNA polymerase sigma factor [Hyphomonadaceae bacterium]|nr:RNA polymerase sigma factor [Hyphomonadaceae bacterium]